MRGVIVLFSKFCLNKTAFSVRPEKHQQTVWRTVMIVIS